MPAQSPAAISAGVAIQVPPAAMTLATMRPWAAVSMRRLTNPGPATGGRAAESLDNALRRGPQELHSLHRAVTARDFELIAKQSSGAVDRAHAFTKAMLWSHASPGTVEVLLVPHIPEEQRAQGWVKAEILRAHETEPARKQIQDAGRHGNFLSGKNLVVGRIPYPDVMDGNMTGDRKSDSGYFHSCTDFVRQVV